MDAADANDDGALDLTDAIFVLSFLFQGGRLASCPRAGRLRSRHHPGRAAVPALRGPVPVGSVPGSAPRGGPFRPGTEPARADLAGGRRAVALESCRGTD